MLPGEWHAVPWYGGAILCDLPSSFQDASEVRQVPDHQEVWTDHSSDRSITVEILERKDIADDHAVAFFLADLADANDARDARLVSERQLSTQEVPHLADVHCRLGVGLQRIPKFNEDSANLVQIYLCVIRLAAQETDILLVLNDPIEIDPRSSSADVPVMDRGEDLFLSLLRTFQIVDWGLFSGTD
mmetsp:Transcript_9264/g.20604  ORF Transcript_9264/g.20604 Transcript_9264/m.20604 type:complete len:187 (+) Transcript_9264:66-626(+)